jgi:hypothetical protein
LGGLRTGSTEGEDEDGSEEKSTDFAMGFSTVRGGVEKLERNVRYK